MNSIYEGRLFTQCSELALHYGKPILVIEGDINSVEKLTDNMMVFYGAVATLALNFKLVIIHTAIKKIQP